MSLWPRNLFVAEDDDVGVRLSQLSEALLVWAMMRGQSGAHPTVADAMLDFNTTQAVIEEAIGEGHWLYLTGQGLNAKIGVDGE